jgi:inosine-uridine nucleoside N-ribohydrolase
VARSRRSLSLALFLACLTLGLVIAARQPAEMPGRLSLIIDTDAGTDDLVAIAYLLARPDVEIDAITTVNGIAHAEAGARNIQRLLRAANRRVDVFVGQDAPLEGRDAFPAAWRQQADEMAMLPAAAGRRPPRPDAVAAILTRLRTSSSPISLLALGPLSNVAAALEREPRTMAKVEQIVIMGGAIDVPGNAPDNAQNPVAEWNMYVDPTAASLVFRAGLPITLVPLDATSNVPIDRPFVSGFGSLPRPPLGRLASQLLESAGEMIDANAYYAWDPLAAVAVTNESVLETRAQKVEVIRTGEERGRTRVGDGDPNALVAYRASPAVFRRLFFGALTRDSR